MCLLRNCHCSTKPGSYQLSLLRCDGGLPGKHVVSAGEADRRVAVRIIDLGTKLAPTAFVSRADVALSTLHRATKIAHIAGPIGHLGVKGATATGVCTGVNPGRRLTIAAFTRHGYAVLVRSWLFQTQRHHGADLATLAISLAQVE